MKLGGFSSKCFTWLLDNVKQHISFYMLVTSILTYMIMQNYDFDCL